MTRAALLVAFALVACSPPPAPTAPPPNPAAPRLNALNATVILLDPSDRYAMCSGEFIAPDRIATAAHCLEAAEATTGDSLSYLTLRALGARDLTPSVAVVIALDEELDLAVLRALEPAPAFVSIAPAPSPGARVMAIGHPKGKLYRETSGMLLAEHSSVISALITVDHGSSGGGLYDEQYHLIGITVRMYAGGNVAEFVSATELLRYL
jgi:S1-C subfamily serine protease